MYTFFSRLNFLSFLDLNVCSFFKIDVIVKDSFLCMHHLGINALKISPLWLAPFFSQNLLWKCVLFQNYIYCNDMHSCLKVSWLFNCCDSGSNIKTVKTKDHGRRILDEIHARLLYFKIISHVTLMWYRGYREWLNWIDRVWNLSVCLFSGWLTRC